MLGIYIISKCQSFGHNFRNFSCRDPKAKTHVWAQFFLPLIRTQDGAKCQNTKNAASTIPFFKNKEQVVYGENREAWNWCNLFWLAIL